MEFQNHKFIEIHVCKHVNEAFNLKFSEKEQVHEIGSLFMHLQTEPNEV